MSSVLGGFKEGQDRRQHRLRCTLSGWPRRSPGGRCNENGWRLRWFSEVRRHGTQRHDLRLVVESEDSGIRNDRQVQDRHRRSIS